MNANPYDDPTIEDDDDTFLAIVGGGVPHAAWTEWDGTNWEVRVAKLNGAASAWTEVVGGASPINHDPTRSAAYVTLASTNGVPWVAWNESDGTSNKVRVSRLNTAGTAWEQPVSGASPINYDPAQTAWVPSLTEVNGVAHVAWSEGSHLRVARLNQAGTAWEHIVGGANPDGAPTGTWPGYPSLADVGGTSMVTWLEFNDATQTKRLLVARRRT